MRTLSTVLSVAALSFGACAASAGASSAYRLTVSPARIAPGGHVTATTTPRLACRVTVTIAGRSFSHAVPHGWVQIAMPRSSAPGHVKLTMSCGGRTTSAGFTIARK